MSPQAGLINRRSGYDFAETALRFRAAAREVGAAIFAEIDHGRNAAGVNMPLRPTLLIVFGNAKGGTPLMQLDQVAGIDLPLKALIWEDAQGQAWVTYNDPSWVTERHGLAGRGAEVAKAIGTGVERLVAAATG